MNKNHDLDPLILKGALIEFLDKGYRGASMRGIAKVSNITTGALYTRYKGKDELFEALIANALNELKAKAMDTSSLYEEALEKRSPELFIRAIKHEEKLYLDLLYEHYDECYLLICKSEGSDIYTRLTMGYQYKVLETIKYFKNGSSRGFDLDAVGILMKSQMIFYKEVLERKYDREKAISVLNSLDFLLEESWKALFVRLMEENDGK